VHRTATLAAIAAFALSVLSVGAGCLYYDEPGDPLAQAVRDAAAAERGVVRRGRGAPWFIVKLWLCDVAADAPAATGPVPEADARLASSLPEQRARTRAAGLRVTLALPPKEPHASMLLRGGQTGFAALARGVAVAEFSEDGTAVGGDAMDVGFVVTVSGRARGRATVELAPAFRDARPGGEEQSIARLAFGAELAAGEALVLDATPGAVDRTVRALFRDGAPAGRRRRLHLQVEAFR
jgi:hypothetical protein